MIHWYSRLDHSAIQPTLLIISPTLYFLKAHAIVKLLESFDWNYVSVIHSDSEYGETGYESIRRAVSKSGKICLAEPIVLHNQVRTVELTMNHIAKS